MRTIIEKPEPLLLRVAEAAERLAISRSKAYELAASGELPGVVKVGGSMRVSARALEAWVEREADKPRDAA